MNVRNLILEMTGIEFYKSDDKILGIQMTETLEEALERTVLVETTNDDGFKSIEEVRYDSINRTVVIQVD